MYYALKFPPLDSAKEVVAENKDVHENGNGADLAPPPRVQVAGAFIMCPMVEGECDSRECHGTPLCPVLILASKESRPSVVVELFAKSIKFFAGSLPLAKAVRGNVSDDPRVEEDFFSDRE